MYWGQVKRHVCPEYISSVYARMHTCVCVCSPSSPNPCIHSLPSSIPRGLYLWTTTPGLHCPVSGWVQQWETKAGGESVRVFILVAAVPSTLLRSWNDWFLLSTYGQLTFMAPAFMDSSLPWLQLTLFLPCPSDLQVVVIVSRLLLVSRCFPVNSPRIKLSLVQPFWVCLLFPTGNPGWHSVYPSLSHTKSWLSCLALKRQLHLL